MTYRELQRLFALPAFAVATTLLAFGASHAIAQVPMSLRGQELNIQDQPDYVPSSEEELLPAAFRRQPVGLGTEGGDAGQTGLVETPQPCRRRGR